MSRQTASELSRSETQATRLRRGGIGIEMKHAATRELFEYWNRRRGRRRAPARSNIDPADIRRVLGDTFLLTADFLGDIRFRLAGTRVCALFVREIKGDAFNSLWNETSQEHIKELLTAILSENVGAVAGVLGRTADGVEIELELLLLPLALDGRTRIRALGVLAPLTPPHWLDERPVIELELRTFRHIGAEQSSLGAPPFGRARKEPRARYGFLVYSGGRELQTDKPTSGIVGLPRP
jgi:hypothetical protein